MAPHQPVYPCQCTLRYNMKLRSLEAVVTFHPLFATHPHHSALPLYASFTAWPQH